LHRLATETFELIEHPGQTERYDLDGQRKGPKPLHNL
jgi:hypothetical protein